MIKKAVVIFSGYNQRAIISFCRVACKQNIPLIIIAKSDTDTILCSKYKNYVKHIRTNLKLDLSYIKSILMEIKKNEDFDEYLILPNSEALNRFVLENKEELKELNFITPLVDKNTYYLISNKHEFGYLCINNNIRVPKELDFNEIDSFPVVIKPKRYFTSDGRIVPPQIVKDEIDLNEFISKDKNFIKDFYIQEYIGGESYYLLYYFCKDGSYKAFFPEKHITTESRKVNYSSNIIRYA